MKNQISKCITEVLCSKLLSNFFKNFLKKQTLLLLFILFTNSKANSQTAAAIYTQAKQELAQKNITTGLDLLLQAAKKGHAEAVYEYGDSFMNGQRSYTNTDSAFYWYAKGYQKKHVLSTIGMGDVYLKLKLSENALEFYEIAAKTGNALANGKAGLIYLNRGLDNEDKDLNFKKAFKYISIAANKGEAISQTNLGKMYKNGWGVPINEAESIKWFKKSAAQNIGSAKGELVRKDNAESIAIIDEFITKIEKNIPGAKIYLVETPQSKTTYYNPNIKKITQEDAMSSTGIVLVGLTHPLLSENKIFTPNKMAITIGSTTYEQPFEIIEVNNVVKYTLTMGNMLEIRNYFYKKRYSKYFLDPSITVSSKADWAVFFAVVTPGIPRDDIFVTEEKKRDKTIKDNIENKRIEKNNEYETQRQKIKEELIRIGEERERKKKNR